MNFEPSDSRLADSPSVRIGENTRATFIGRTYLHLFGAIIAFTLIEVWLFSSGLADPIARSMLGVNWLLVLGGFVVVSWIASRAAHTAKSLGAQYAALGALRGGRGFDLRAAALYRQSLRAGRHSERRDRHPHRICRTHCGRFPQPQGLLVPRQAC